jgi:Flp pilus assembly protein TadD
MLRTGRIFSKRPPGKWRCASLAMAAGAVLVVAGCQTSQVLGSAGSTAQPLIASGDISQSDLDQGKAQFMNGNYGLAEKHFRKAVELRANNAEAWLGLAASYDRLGRFDFADRAYDQLVKLAGRQPRIVNNMGYSQLLRGNRKKARTLFLEARAALPGDAVIEANMTLLESG